MRDRAIRLCGVHRFRAAATRPAPGTEPPYRRRARRPVAQRHRRKDHPDVRTRTAGWIRPDALQTNARLGCALSCPLLRPARSPGARRKRDRFLPRSAPRRSSEVPLRSRLCAEQPDVQPAHELALVRSVPRAPGHPPRSLLIQGTWANAMGVASLARPGLRTRSQSSDKVWGSRGAALGFPGPLLDVARSAATSA